MKKLFATSLICLSFALSTNASANWWSPSRLYIGAYGGYGSVSGGYGNDGQVTEGRLTLGIHAFEYQNLSFGGEVGVQSGNDMRISANSDYINNDLDGVPSQAVLKPFVDFLVTAKGQFSSHQPLFGIFKIGFAYRQMQIDDGTSTQSTLHKINAEVQAGLGYSITEHATLTALYQGIYAGNNAGENDDSNCNTIISRIPTQQAGFLGIDYSF